MRLSINMDARLERHFRNISTAHKKRFLRLLKQFKIFALLIVLILPVYPSFGEMNTSSTDTSVGKYDESTIILSYEGETGNTLFSHNAGFIKPTSVVSDTRDTSGMNRLLSYTVEDGDSLGSVAAKFHVTVSSILWANDLSRSDIIQPGQILKVPPVSGLIYHVVSMDTVDAIALKFSVSSDAILTQNKINATQELKIGQELIIPGAKPVIERSVDPVAPKQVAIARSVVKKSTAVARPVRKSAPDISDDESIDDDDASDNQYASEYTGGGNKFAWGNCTYYVANHKHVTWRGNAGQWLRNAAAAGVPTGKTPTVGAIISFRGDGYSWYGHVGIVVDMDGDDLIVKDMNYRRLNEVTIRKVPKGDDSIRGYIYTD